MRRLQAMELFVGAVREGSFSAAGRRAGLSPAAVSRQVAALEAALNVQLLNRTSRTLTLTDAGREYLAPKARTRRLSDVQLACEEIAARWPVQ